MNGEHDEEVIDLIRKLYEAASQFDLAFIHAVQGESILDGDEYEKLSDVLVEAEEFLELKNKELKG